MQFVPTPKVSRLNKEDGEVPGIYDLMTVLAEHVTKLDEAIPVYRSLRDGLIPVHLHYHSVMEAHFQKALSSVAEHRHDDPYVVAQSLLELAGASVKIAADLLFVWKRTNGLLPDDSRNRRPKIEGEVSTNGSLSLATKNLLGTSDEDDEDGL